MLIDYTNIDIYQEDHLVLSDVNLQVGSGEFIYLIGQVGSGKTSMLKTIYGELDTHKGKATVLDTDIKRLRKSQWPRLRKQLGIVFQDFQLLPDRSVAKNLDFVLRATSWRKKKERRERIAEVLERVGLPDKADQRPFELSGGEQQRICIARAILNRPQLILADEPTGNLDYENGRRVISLLRSIHEAGNTVIISTHNMQWLEEFPGTVYCCQNGKLVKDNRQQSTDNTSKE